MKIPSTLLEGGVGEVDVVFGIHIFFEIGKGHYYEITTIFTFFLSLGVIFFVFLTSSIFIPLLVFRYSVTRYCITLFSNTRCRPPSCPLAVFAMFLPSCSCSSYS